MSRKRLSKTENAKHLSSNAGHLSSITLASRIEELQPYLERIAYNLVLTHYPQEDPQELLQEMSLYIMERGAAEPEFLAQADGYITRAAAWRAREYCRSDIRGVNHGRERSAFSLDQENPEGIDNAEAFAEPEPDRDVVLSVRAALETLGESTRKVAELMMAGFKGDELAAEAGMTKAGVSYHRNLLKAALASCA